MSLRSYLRLAAEHVLGVSMVPGQLPLGCDLRADVRRLWPHLEVKTIIDVGANVGQTTKVFAAQFPAARIIAFEPGGTAYTALSALASGIPQVTTIRAAVGDTVSRSRLYTTPLSTMNSLVPPSGQNGFRTRESFEEVDVTTLDDFCCQTSIKQVDILKIDTEGYDLKVLMGAIRLLGAGSICLILTEVGLSAENTTHIPLQHTQAFLGKLSYRLAALYDQTTQHSGVPALRFCNALFFHQKCNEVARSAMSQSQNRLRQPHCSNA